MSTVVVFPSAHEAPLFRTQEFQHTRAVLTFLCLFMSGTESAGPYREQVLIAMQESGPRLLRQCLLGLASASPENLVDHQVELTGI